MEHWGDLLIKRYPRSRFGKELEEKSFEKWTKEGFEKA